MRRRYASRKWCLHENSRPPCRQQVRPRSDLLAAEPIEHTVAIPDRGFGRQIWYALCITFSVVATVISLAITNNPLLLLQSLAQPECT
jgi:hypothetical protein